MSELKLKCISLIGDLANWGKCDSVVVGLDITDFENCMQTVHAKDEHGRTIAGYKRQYDYETKSFRQLILITDSPNPD